MLIDGATQSFARWTATRTGSAPSRCASAAEIGDMVRVRITDYKHHWLDGEVLAPALA